MAGEGGDDDVGQQESGEQHHRQRQRRPDPLWHFTSPPRRLATGFVQETGEPAGAVVCVGERAAGSIGALQGAAIGIKGVAGAPAKGVGVARPFASAVEAEDLLATEMVGDQGAVAPVVEVVVFARA